MPLVEALDSFDHYGPRKRGSQFSVSLPTALDLQGRGLVAIVGARHAHPTPAAGGTSSASPVARASRKQTATRSKPGAKRRPTGPSS